MNYRLITVLCGLAFLTGCASLPYGELLVPNDGALSVEFVHPSDDSLTVRKRNMTITHVVTPTDRCEELLKQWTVDEFSAEVEAPEMLKGDPFQATRHSVPKPQAWEWLLPYLQPTDVIWTFGQLDQGFIVLRGNRLFCMVITEHCM